MLTPTDRDVKSAGMILDNTIKDENIMNWIDTILIINVDDKNIDIQ